MASEAQVHPGMVLLGRIVGLFGVKGWVKIHSDTGPRENILGYSPWYLLRAGQWQRCSLQAGRRHGKGLVAQLEGCADRDSAAELVGCTIAIRREQLPEIEHEYYWRDLLGLQVRTTGGVALGHVIELMETGANDVLVVREQAPEIDSNDQRERLIPYIPGQVVKKVDLQAGDLIVDWDPEF